jgi:stage V sporulation protein R
MDYARDTMRAIYRLWTRPIYLETMVKEHKRLLIFDGKNILDRKVE